MSPYQFTRYSFRGLTDARLLPGRVLFVEQECDVELVLHHRSGQVTVALDERAEQGQEREHLGLGEDDLDHTGTAFVSKTFGTRGCAKVCWKASRA